MNPIIRFFLLLILLVSVQTQLRGETEASVSRVVADGFRAAPLLNMTVRIQKMDRKSAVAELRRLADDPGQQDNVFGLCRLLFTNRSGGAFRGPLLGAAQFLAGAPADWSLAPFTLVNGVPFCIVRGYTLGGSPEGPSNYLDHCLAECDWSKVHYAEKTPDELAEALHKLLKSRRWTTNFQDEEQLLSAQIK